jgi:hypothetical protein
MVKQKVKQGERRRECQRRDRGKETEKGRRGKRKMKEGREKNRDENGEAAEIKGKKELKKNEKKRIKKELIKAKQETGSLLGLGQALPGVEGTVPSLSLVPGKDFTSGLPRQGLVIGSPYSVPGPMGDVRSQLHLPLDTGAVPKFQS